MSRFGRFLRFRPYSDYVRLSSTVTQTVTGSVEVDTLTFSGLNYILRQPSGPPIVSAGHRMESFSFFFDANGNLIDTGYSESSTPSLIHLPDQLC